MESKETSKRTKANNYDLSFLGILAVLRIEFLKEGIDKVDYSRIRMIIAKYEEWFPPVFGKWKFFQTSGLEETALLRLKNIIATLFADRDSMFGFVSEPLGPAADIKTTIAWFFYFLGLVPVGRRFEEEPRFIREARIWLTALKLDKDIKAYLMEELQWLSERLAVLSNDVARIDEVLREEQAPHLGKRKERVAKKRKYAS